MIHYVPGKLTYTARQLCEIIPPLTKATWATVQDDHTKGRPCLYPNHRTNIFLSSSRIRVELIRRTERRVSARMVQRRFVAAGYRSRRPARFPKLTVMIVPACGVLVRDLWTVASTKWMDVSTLPLWCGLLCMHQANRNWWRWMARTTSNATLASCATISFPGQLSKKCVLLHDNATPDTARNIRNFLAGGGWVHTVACSKPWYKPHKTYVGADRGVYQRYE